MTAPAVVPGVAPAGWPTDNLMWRESAYTEHVTTGEAAIWRPHKPGELSFSCVSAVLSRRTGQEWAHQAILEIAVRRQLPGKDLERVRESLVLRIDELEAFAHAFSSAVAAARENACS